ncbi:MAG TPA: carbohydrate-binding protein, partial [Flavisolibacter sp.]|nr:carbohydrate-binding protein [Flavisolibacter sp.]
YTDKGGAITPLTGKDVLVLRPSKVQAESADAVSNLQKNERGLGRINNKSYFVLKNIDLKDVNQLTYRYSSKDYDAAIEVHTDAANGQVISTAAYKATGAWNQFNEVSAPVTDPGGKHDLYFVFVRNEEPNRNLASLDWIRFDGGKEVKIATPVPSSKRKLASSAQSKETGTTVAPVTGSEKKAAAKSPGAALIAKSDCNTCHRVNQKLIGPSFTEIAKRYKTQAAAGRLADKVIKGGAGIWGQVPMTPHPQLSKKDATEMVKYILSVKR